MHSPRSGILPSLTDLLLHANIPPAHPVSVTVKGVCEAVPGAVRLVWPGVTPTLSFNTNGPPFAAAVAPPPSCSAPYEPIRLLVQKLLLLILQFLGRERPDVFRRLVDDGGGGGHGLKRRRQESGRLSEAG